MRQYLSFCHRRKSVYDSLQSRAASTSKTKLLNCEFIKYVVAWWSNIKALRTKLIRWVPINFSHLPTVQNFTLSSCQNILLLSSRVHHCSIICTISPASVGLVPQASYTGALPLDPNGGLSSPKLPDKPPPFQIPDPPLRLCPWTYWWTYIPQTHNKPSFPKSWIPP